MVAIALERPPTARPVTQPRSWTQVPDQVGAASQRRPAELGGFNLSARAVLLYGAIKRCCRNQQHHRDGASCGVSLALLGAMIGVKVRQTRNLVRQLEAVGLIALDVAQDFRGTNTFRVLPVPAELPTRSTPAKAAPVLALLDPRQKSADETRRALSSSQLPSAFPKPTPERQRGAGASGPALPAADNPPAAQPGRAPGGRKGQSKAAHEGKNAKIRPLHDAAGEEFERVLRRHLRIELPAIPDELLAYALAQLRAAKADEALGGASVRNPLRYALAVAKKHWGGFQGPPAPKSRDVWRPEAAPEHVDAVFLRPGQGAKPAPGLSQGEPTPSVTSESSEIDACTHGVTLDKVCRDCEGKRGALPWDRAIRRQLLGLVVIPDDDAALTSFPGQVPPRVPPRGGRG